MFALGIVSNAQTSKESANTSILNEFANKIVKQLKYIINMKRFILSLTILVMAASLTAQVSVWDGSYEEFDTSNEKGLTEDNPILIENAAQLAYMSELFFCNEENQDRYYKLTTDIDLNNMEWQPIGGAHPAASCDIFYGFFDGDNHTIYRLTSPLFDDCTGYIKNITIKESTISKSGWEYFGAITRFSDGLIENCHNHADINFETTKMSSAAYVGGVVGIVNSGDIRNCTNHGDINIYGEEAVEKMHVGGVTSKSVKITDSHNYGDITVKDCKFEQATVGGISSDVYDMFCCSNHGGIDIEATITDSDYDYALKCGGISGVMLCVNRKMNACYNKGDIDVDVTCGSEKIVSCGGLVACYDDDVNYNFTTEVSHSYNVGDVTANIDNGVTYAGGIVGMGAYNADEKGTLLKIYSCYNAGEMEAKFASGIVGFADDGINAEVDNCFMSGHDNGYGDIVTDDFMKTEEFVNMLNKYGKFFVKDVEPFVNDGYPVLLDYSNIDGVDVAETIVENNISVFPNPARDVVRLTTDNGQQTTVRIYNTLGMLVDEIEMNSNEIEINVSEYNSGMYFIEVQTEEGNFVVKLIVEN